MENNQISETASAAVVDESALTEEELKRLAIIFDVLIDVDFYLKYTKELTDD